MAERYAGSTWLRSLTYKARDARNLSHQFRLIKELQAAARRRTRKIREEADLVEQAELITVMRPTTMKDLSMRPQMSGRKSQVSLSGVPVTF